MLEWVRSRIRRAYTRDLKQSLSTPPDHIAVIQDGNRRYAREHGMDSSDGHAHGADTTEEMLHWCNELSIDEVTLYTLSTENFSRPDDELAALFDLIAEKLYTLADADLIHENQVRIHALGDLNQLPQQVVDAVRYAERQTEQYRQLKLNIALAYGGRNELFRATQQIMREVADEQLQPCEITTETIEERLYREPLREVDLIIRTGGDERTSNFLPWYANGNEAAVYFCTPYWPEFDKIEFLRAMRTYESRESSWQQTRVRRAVSLAKALAETGYQDRPRVIHRLRQQLSGAEATAFDEEVEVQSDQPHPNIDLRGED